MDVLQYAKITSTPGIFSKDFQGDENWYSVALKVAFITLNGDMFQKRSFPRSRLAEYHQLRVLCHSLQPRYSFLTHFAQTEAVKVIGIWVKASQQVRKLSPLAAGYLFQNVDIDVNVIYVNWLGNVQKKHLAVQHLDFVVAVLPYFLHENVNV